MWGTYILVNARVGRAFEEGTGLAIAMCVASLIALPFGLADGGAKLLQPHITEISTVREAVVGAARKAVSKRRKVAP